MGDGISKIFESGLEVGFTVGNLRGLLKGAATAAAVISGTALVIGGGVYVSKKIKKLKAQKLALQPEGDAVPEVL